MQYHRAKATFVHDNPDGSSVRVVAGDVLPESHPLVQLDRDGAGVLFSPLDDGEAGDKPKGRRGARPAAPPAPAPAKDAEPAKDGKS